MKKNFLSLLLLFVLTNTFSQPKIWTKEKANNWYKNQGWLVGADFLPSTAINQLEMWQAGTFDASTIDKELGWAQSIGMNVMRVYPTNRVRTPHFNSEWPHETTSRSKLRLGSRSSIDR